MKFEIIDYGVKSNPPIKKVFDCSRVTIVHTGNLSKGYAGDWMNNLPRMDNVRYESWKMGNGFQESVGPM